MRFRKAPIKSPWQRMRSGAIFLVCVFVVAVIGYRFLGPYDWIGAVWMVVITISTVGHGEQSGFGPGLQILTIAVILFGMTASVYTFSGFFMLVLEGELERLLGRRRVTRELQQLSGHVIVCGYGRMGEHLVHDLLGQSQSLVIIENDPAVVEEAIAEGLLCVHGDATDEEMLLSVRIHQAAALATTLPSDADSVFITLTARDLNPKLQIISRAEQRSTEKKLRQAGANRIVMPTIVGAKQMVRMITRPGTARLIDLVNEPSFEGLEFDEVRIKGDSQLIGKPLKAVPSLHNQDLLVVAIQHEDDQLNLRPKGDVVFASGDTIMLMGHPSDIDRFRADV